MHRVSFLLFRFRSTRRLFGSPEPSAVAPPDLYRQAYELVLTRLYLREIVALDDPDPGLEERLVRLGSVLVEAADR